MISPPVNFDNFVKQDSGKEGLPLNSLLRIMFLSSSKKHLNYLNSTYMDT